MAFTMRCLHRTCTDHKSSRCLDIWSIIASRRGFWLLPFTWTFNHWYICCRLTTVGGSSCSVLIMRNFCSLLRMAGVTSIGRNNQDMNPVPAVIVAMVFWVVGWMWRKPVVAACNWPNKMRWKMYSPNWRTVAWRGWFGTTECKLILIHWTCNPRTKQVVQ